MKGQQRVSCGIDGTPPSFYHSFRKNLASSRLSGRNCDLDSAQFAILVDHIVLMATSISVKLVTDLLNLLPVLYAELNLLHRICRSERRARYWCARYLMIDCPRKF